MYNNFRRDPKEFAQYLDQAVEFLTGLEIRVTSETKKELAELLHKLWNIDGIRLNWEERKEVRLYVAGRVDGFPKANGVNIEKVFDLLVRSEKEGSGYLQQIVDYIKSLMK